ncbi:DUF4174 domain-containing protein [Rhizobium sp. 57MFTsu3.2]|uniref:DUF4174 domain-containing protein n=1 Tax=Rhizobium sp. 57MFTsu3.2 TaxID=1048681 RepID=UPI001FF03614|nr:DUF4174 domain-containing protein [Rhizobium sp. 57MFTsu3.2]NMN74329.1 uncharacterized protein DUF4174 [Rhizobium sp. 57MFTsu3.2]
MEVAGYMLRSLFKEIIGASPATDDSCPSLLGFRNLSWVLVLFEGAADDRPEMQEQLLANQQGALEKQAVTILRVAGGGGFDSLDIAADIGADDVRNDREGPSPDEFEAILVDPNGITKFRSNQPVSVPYLAGLVDRLFKEIQ